ncbi:NADP-dependent oxidoreductase [Cupriavidus oxalaticus]|jgi:NADPH-dependent curcumin reductase CurA|uniref:NADP-dependent oxidoreductase n=1 Tax=Cupriavidus oxalaticus TaxID=96344 RepID=A0A375FXN0_9BURK|nr:NADP-dependent oxidoreductase [Cupriavidus oxalaticus]QRQ85968.1 NADP-dependent oxidoreductase [Cupriavidus oxalaticus]QRQ95706.1 NADP-dependent oxidoreductase [Cupriavidus oxalaticus]WQD84374.1 NADP-dependent oxidoreductase [Cupriavidus oxalaticus]SPC12271.1 NADPH-dependent curcumin reductase [Cupriavidus oxalaticus]
MSERNTKIVMKRHPAGMVQPEDFEVVRADLPTLSEGEALVRVMYLSLDPYMRPMMDPVRSYVEPLTPGQVMPGGTVGEVVASRDPELPKGTLVAAPLGWQSHGVVTRGAVRVVDPELGPPSAALGALGMTGVTAHYGMLALARPRAGETVVVTAASGAVGSVAGQIAKLQGCRVVGIAGGAQKCRYVMEELGFDACVDYRAADFEQQLAAATPDYVDVLFENVGGPVMDAVLRRIADHARIALCGNISQYNEQAPYGFQGMRQLLMHRVTVHAFVIADHRAYWPAAQADLAQWLREGKLKYREDVSDGLRDAPHAFIRMLTGGNFGKQLVRVS